MNVNRRWQIAQQVELVFKEHSNCQRIPGPTLASIVVARLAPSSEQWSQTAYDVQTYIEEEIKAGNLTRTKGRTGGISRSYASSFANKAVQDVAINPVVVDAINNHTCPCCGNDRCSKSERTCWKCGGNLH